jgi:hypothetical protein
MNQNGPPPVSTPKPRWQARLAILLIGGIALLGIVLMCAVVFVIILDRT